ncbi:5385_t:CDS:2, partial [Cetraspora pellucida]
NINSFQFQSFNEALDLIESDINIETNLYYNDELDPCYNDELISSIIRYHLDCPSLFINIYPESDHWYSTILFNYNNVRFRRTLRMNKSSFWMIVNKIKDHKNFKDIPNNKQNPVEKQLAITLYRLVIEAIKFFKKDVIIWPRGNYRQKVHKRFKNLYSFLNVIGALDGSHMNLFEAASKPNKNYAIYLQAVVDHQGLFINYNVGYPASVHDVKVFWNSSLYCYRNQLFKDNDYILADSAYPISLNIIPSIINPSYLRQTAFNKKHKLQTKNTKIATELIKTSLILHNLLERDGDEWEESSERVVMY